MSSYSKTECFLGIDAGTQSVKAALWSGEGKQLRSAAADVSLLCRGDRVEQDPDALYAAVTDCIRELLRSDDCEVLAVGLDAQMAGVVGVDGRGNAVGNYDSWLDVRCLSGIDKLKPYETELISTSGGQLSVSHAPKILYQKENEPERYRATAEYVPLSAYLTARMCGGKTGAYYDCTHLHFNVFSDIMNKSWNTAAIREFGLDERKFPRIVSPECKAGEISAECAALTGLRAGTPVIAGAGDTASSAYGAGIIRENLLYDVAGTASVFAASTRNFTPDTKYKTLSYALSPVKDLFLPSAYIGGGGLCIRKFRDESGLSYAELEKLAVRVSPGSGGAVYVPHESGRTCPFDPSVKGGFYNVTEKTGVGEKYRAVLEGIAYEYKFFMRALGDISGDTVYCTGGGANSEFFCKIKADVLGLDYVATVVKDGATLGVAALAASSVGASAENMLAGAVVYGEKIKHDRENTRKYEAYAEKYTAYVNNIEDG